MHLCPQSKEYRWFPAWCGRYKSPVVLTGVLLFSFPYAETKLLLPPLSAVRMDHSDLMQGALKGEK